MIAFISTSITINGSSPYGTTRVFSSTVTNDEWRIAGTELSWTELTSRRTEYRPLSITVHVLLCFTRFHGNVCLASRWLAMALRERVFSEPLASNGLPLWLHYSGFQAPCHTILRRVPSHQQLSEPISPPSLFLMQIKLPVTAYHFIPLCMLHCLTCYFICILVCYWVSYFVLVMCNFFGPRPWRIDSSIRREQGLSSS
jgi:hypothetical protein